MPFFILFVAFPVLELIALIKVGGSIGVLPTLMWIVLTGIAGILIMRTQGFLTMMRMRERMAEGQAPAGEIANGFLITLAGLLLLLPGFITDALGLLLLLPPVRLLLKSAAIKAFKAQGGVAFSATTMRTAGRSERPVYDAQDNRINKGNQGSNVIDGEYRRED